MSSSSCPPPIRSRQYVGGPTPNYVTVQSRGVGGASADLLVQLPFPCSVFFIASMLAPTDSVYFHLTALGKVYTANAITELGTENWIPMTSLIASGSIYRAVIHLREPVKQFYLDLGQEAGGQQTLTIACYREIGDIEIVGGLYT